MADQTDSAGNAGATPIPESIAPGLDLFATAWLQFWGRSGGSVHFESDGRVGFYMPEYFCSPEFVEVDSALPEAVRRDQDTFRRNHYHGKMRAMLDFLESVPCGTDAVKAHMRNHGMQYFIGEVGRPL